MYPQRAQFLYSFENQSANFEVIESNTVIQSALFLLLPEARREDYQHGDNLKSPDPH